MDSVKISRLQQLNCDLAGVELKIKIAYKQKANTTAYFRTEVQTMLQSLMTERDTLLRQRNYITDANFRNLIDKQQ